MPVLMALQGGLLEGVSKEGIALLAFVCVTLLALTLSASLGVVLFVRWLVIKAIKVTRSHLSRAHSRSRALSND